MEWCLEYQYLLIIYYKGGSNSYKYDHPPVVIIAQERISKIYNEKSRNKSNALQALQNRFFEVCVEQQGNIFELNIIENEEDELIKLMENPDSIIDQNDRENDKIKNINTDINKSSLHENNISNTEN